MRLRRHASGHEAISAGNSRQAGFARCPAGRYRPVASQMTWRAPRLPRARVWTLLHLEAGLPEACGKTPPGQGAPTRRRARRRVSAPCARRRGPVSHRGRSLAPRDQAVRAIVDVEQDGVVGALPAPIRSPTSASAISTRGSSRQPAKAPPSVRAPRR